MLRFAVSWLALLNTHEFTVIPVPKLQVAPLWKLLPVRITLSVCPCVPLVGFRLLSEGGGSVACVTVNPLANVLLCVSGLVTVTLRVPVVAVPPMLRFAVSWLALLNTHEFTVIPVPKLQVAPLWKLLPARITLSVCPCVPELGVADVNDGGAIAPGCTV